MYEDLIAYKINLKKLETIILMENNLETIENEYNPMKDELENEMKLLKDKIIT